MLILCFASFERHALQTRGSYFVYERQQDRHALQTRGSYFVYERQQGLIISYSTKHFTHSAEFQNTIIPDVIIESSYKDFSNGIDPVYEWIKTQ